MTITLIGRAVSSSAGRVEVTHESDHLVTVRWMCGEERRFTRMGLKETLATVKRLAGLGEWIGLKDHYGVPFAVIVKSDGQLLADDRPRVLASITPAGVAWSELRKAIKQTLKDGDDWEDA